MSDIIEAPEEPTTLGHPTGLFYLFFAELWERFSFLWHESIVNALHGYRNF